MQYLLYQTANDRERLIAERGEQSVRHRLRIDRGQNATLLQGATGIIGLLRLAAHYSRRRGEVTPRHEHDADWKGAVDTLRRRIRKATGSNLLGAVVLTARGPTGGYRMAPRVQVRRD